MNLIITALELGLISSLTVEALFLSYNMLGVCDLSTDGAFTFGATVGAVVALAGHPFLAIFAAIFAGALSGFITAFLQTKMGVDSLLSGIVVNTGLYSINIAVMGGSSLLNMNRTETVFTKAKTLLGGTFLAGQYRLVVIVLITAIVVFLLSIFLKLRIGLSIRATGDNPDMVKSSSINPAFTTIIGLCISNSFTALSGCLLACYQKSVNITIGTGMLTIALASLLIGGTFIGNRRPIPLRAIGAVLGAFIFRLVYTAALRVNMPAFMLKLVSSVIVVFAISGPYLNKKFPMFLKKHRKTSSKWLQSATQNDISAQNRISVQKNIFAQNSISAQGCSSIEDGSAFEGDGTFEGGKPVQGGSSTKGGSSFNGDDNSPKGGSSTKGVNSFDGDDSSFDRNGNSFDGSGTLNNQKDAAKGADNE